jgi:hypothetical protein
MRIESATYMAGWRLVNNLDGSELDRKIQQAGWNFFCHAGKVKAVTFGRDEQKMIRRGGKCPGALLVTAPAPVEHDSVSYPQPLALVPSVFETAYPARGN